MRQFSFFKATYNFTEINVLHVALKKKDFLENLCILFCFVQLKGILFNLLCVSFNFLSVLWKT